MLSVAEQVIRCQQCERAFLIMERSGVANLLPNQALSYEDALARVMKLNVQERFAMIDRVLPAAQASFVTFLNLGYLPNDNPRFAARGPQHPAFNRNSTMLLFEVLGSCDLDGKVVFDLGAGRGGNVTLISRYYSPKRLFGLDLSPANVEFCTRHCEITNGGFAVADVEYLPIKDNKVDVVLNLESSHYYPNILHFFNEVYRVLAPGGEFLFADILPATVFRAAREHFEKLGLQLQREQDISENVLLSCEAITQLRETPRYAKLYETFTVVPGSQEFEYLRNGVTQYRTMHLRKV